MSKTLLAAAVAALMCAPFAQAAGDKAKEASADKSKASSSASQGATTRDNKGGDAMFKSMDKNKDGSVSRDEAKGSAHEKDFAKLDKNNDGKLSREELAAAESSGKAAATGGTAASTGTPATPKASSGSTSTNKK